jgi:signal transduction histidine kinase
VLVALCAALSWLLGVRLIARPAKLVVEQARAIGRGELDQRLHLPARDELGELAAEMNQMCDRLQEARERVEVETQTRIAAVEQLRHADRLKTVGTLASGIAHELGTPINVVEGHAALLREDPTAGPAAKESAEVIGRQCKRMAAIIRQLLDFARRGGPRSMSSDPLEVARQTSSMVAPLARQQGIAVDVDGVADTKLAIAFGALQQVLANLYVNALHAMHEGGTLSVRVEPREAQAPGAAETRDYVALAVRDTGVGMTPETRDRIFEPFFTTKDVGEGTGLGLAVAYAIVEDHGGFIDVESTPGRGSAFTVYLPREGSSAT